MDMNIYQSKANKTAIYPIDGGIIYTTLGLSGEAGEIANKVKKILRDDYGEVSDVHKYEIADELGNVLWYVATLAHELDYSLADIAIQNLTKLSERSSNNKLGGSGDAR